MLGLGWDPWYDQTDGHQQTKHPACCLLAAASGPGPTVPNFCSVFFTYSPGVRSPADTMGAFCWGPCTPGSCGLVLRWLRGRRGCGAHVVHWLQWQTHSISGDRGQKGLGGTALEPFGGKKVFYQRLSGYKANKWFVDCALMTKALKTGPWTQVWNAYRKVWCNKWQLTTTQWSWKDFVTMSI